MRYLAFALRSGPREPSVAPMPATADAQIDGALENCFALGVKVKVPPAPSV
jgi:hypothetical protein